MSASPAVLCVDIGSTYTKALLVDLESATLVAGTDHATWATGDVGDAVTACRAKLAVTDGRAMDARVLACSSAGGGLAIAVVGFEALVTAEAGRRVALSSGGRVVATVAVAGLPAGDAAAAVHEAILDADVVLLTGGTDGGNPEALLAGARAVGTAGWGGPTVVAGNVAAQDAAAEILGASPGRPQVRFAENAVPRIGVLSPAGARAAIREMFLRHVIGGKGLSADRELMAAIRGATPDVMLRGVELVADLVAAQSGDVAVVDIGGSTTDVYSVCRLDPEEAGLAREVIAPTTATRTVEADLGMRHSAPGVVATLDLALDDPMHAAAARRAADPAFRPLDDAERAIDHTIARTAAQVAVRRHAGRARVVVSPEGRVVERTGVDLREVGLLFGSGGVLRHAAPVVAHGLLQDLVVDHDPEGWQLPRRARLVIYESYLLVAIGLLAEDHPDVARGLLRGTG